jgi:hypothetical protein
VHVDERPHAAAAADDRQAPAGDFPPDRAVCGDRRSGAVEVAVAQHHPIRAEHRALERGDRRRRAPELLRRIGDQRVVLAVDGSRRAGRVGEGDALGDDARDACLLSGRDEIARALRAQAVGEREVAHHLARVKTRRNRRQLMDDRLRAGGLDGASHGVGVERVGDDRLGARGDQRRRLLGRAGHARHLVAIGDQQSQQRRADRARGAGEEDPHAAAVAAPGAGESAVAAAPTAAG